MPEQRWLFVYGLVDARTWTDGGRALRAALAQAPGVESDRSPDLLVAGQLGALVSEVPAVAYGVNLEANVADLAWLEPRARAHAGVIALAFAQQAVLPMRFGTLLSGQDALAEALQAQEAPLLQELAAVAGHEEWTVRFCANPEAEVERRAAAQLSRHQGGQGANYLLRRQFALQGQQRVLTELRAKAEAAAATLAPLALAVGGTLAEVAGLAGGARSLCSCVYRIAQEQRAPFLERLDRLEQQTAPEGLALLVSGPWPPTPKLAFDGSSAGG